MLRQKNGLKKAIIAACALWAIVFAGGASCAKDVVRDKQVESTLEMFRKMRIGDWAMYYISERYSMRLQVVDKGANYVTIDRKQFIGGAAAMGSYQLRYDFDEIERNLENGRDLDGIIPMTTSAIARETVQIEDRTYVCDVYTMNSPDAEIKTYVNANLPLDGIVQVRRKGVVIRRIVAYGYAGEQMKHPGFQ